MAWTGRGWPGSKLAKPGKEKQKSLAYNWPALVTAGGAKNWSSLPRNLDQPGQDQITGHAYLFRVYLEWSVSDRMCSTQAQPEATKTCAIINMTIIEMLSLSTLYLSF